MGLSVVKINQTTEQTHSGDTNWTDVPGTTTAALSSGVPYLIIASAQIGQDSQQRAGMQLLHGSTAFPESDGRLLGDNSPDTKCTYRFVKVWTPGSAETLKVQFRANNGTTLVKADNINIIAVPLDHVSLNTDYFTVEFDTDTDLSDGAAHDHASLTFTPPVTGHDWLILGTLQCDIASTTSLNFDFNLEWSGGVTSSDPNMRLEARNANEIFMVPAQVVRNLANASHTVKWVGDLTGTGATGDTMLWSTLIAIDLDTVFEKHAFECNPGDDLTGVSTTDYATEAATCTLTPDTASEDMLVMGLYVHDSSGIHYSRGRLQSDNSDLNSGVTTAAQGLNETWAGSTAEHPATFDGIDASVSAVSHTYDMDASFNVSSTGLDDTCIVAISLVAPSAGPTAPTGLALDPGLDDDNVPLVWTDNATGETGYYVQRDTSSGFTPGAGKRVSSDLGANAEDWIDTTVSPDQQYYYLVEVYDGVGSAYSSELPVKTAPARPTLVALNNTDPSITDPARQLFIDWSDNTAGVYPHSIRYRETAGSPPWSAINVPQPTTEWVIPLLVDATEYEVTVVAYDGALESGKPTPLTATTGTLTVLPMIARGMAVGFGRALLSVTQAEAIVSTDTMLYIDTAYGIDPIVGGIPTFLRAGTKTVLDRKRLLLDLIADYPSIEWLEARPDLLHRRPGLLLEQARTKDLQGVAGEALDTWSLTNATVTADAVIAPDGTLTADKLVATSTVQPRAELNFAPPGSDTTYAWSVWVRKGTNDFAALATFRTTDTGFAIFNLDTKVVVSSSNVIAAGFTGEEADGGWFRVFIVDETLSTDATNVWKVLQTDGTTFSTGSGVGDFVYYWGGDLEIGGWPTSYIRDSGTAAVSRVVDTYFHDFLWSPQEMTIYGAYIDRGMALADSLARPFTVGDDVAGAAFFLRNGSGNLLAGHDNGGSVLETAAGGLSIVFNDLVEFNVRLDANGATRLDTAVNGSEFDVGTPTADLALASVWGEKRVYLNRTQAGAAVSIGGMALLLLKVEPQLLTGQQSRDLVLLPGGET